MNKISVIIIGKNEADRLEKALKSAQWADEIVFVDSGSSDRTIQIAGKFTDKIYFRELDDFSSQRNFAINKCSNDWVFSLDCDEIISAQLKESIIAMVNSTGLDKYAAFRIKRINKLFGKVLRYATANDFTIRLFRKDKAKFIQPIHEFLKVNGKIGNLKGELLHNSTVDIRSEFDKTERYTELESRLVLEKNIKPSFFKIYFCPILVFLNILILKKGLLDGGEGIIYAFVSARYSFVKYYKAYKLSKNPRYLERLISKRFNEISNQFPDNISDDDSRLNCLLNNLPEVEGNLVLEIGCGKGRFTNAVCKKNAICIGVDMSENFLREAVKKNRGIFLKSNATDLSFKSKSFDAAFAVEVIEHLPDLENFIKETARVLKPEGSLFIIDRNILSINNRRHFVPNVIIKKYHEIKNEWMYPRGFPYTEKWFFKYEVIKVLKSYFTEVESRYVISDSEKKSKIAFLFQKVPISRHFILWKAKGPKV